MSGETHRLFFALWPDDASREALASAARAVRQRHHPVGRATAAARYHVTLQFLGSYPVWPEDIVARAIAAAGEVIAEPFGLSVDRAASFGSRVWWIGPAETPPELTRLVLRLRDALRRNAVPHERLERFTPHVTILRDADRALAPTPMPPVVWKPDDFVLAASSSPGSGEYRVLQRWPLARAADPAGPSQAGLWDP